MAERIERDDLLSNDAIKAILELAAALDKSNEALKELIITAKKSNTEISGAKGTKDLAEATKRAATNTTQLTEEQKKNIKIQNDLKRATDQLAFAKTKEYVELEKAKRATRDQQNEVKKAISNTNTWGKALGSFQFKFNFLGNAVSALSAGFAGLAANVGGKVVGAMVSFFTKSELGMELIERKVAGFNAAMGVLAGNMIEFGSKISGSFEKPIEDVGTFYSKMMTLIGAIGGPATAAKMQALGMSMDMASQAAEKYTAKQQELEDLKRSQIVSRAEANRSLKQARLDFENDTLAVETRLNGLKNALNIEKQIADAEIDLQKQIVLQIESVNAEKKKANMLLDDDLLKLENAKAKVIELETESLGRQLRATRQYATEKERLDKEALDKAKGIFTSETAARKAAFDEQIKYAEGIRKKNEQIARKGLDEIIAIIDEEVAYQLEEEEKLSEAKHNRDLFDAQSRRELIMSEMTNQFDAKKTQLQLDYEAEIATAEKIGADTNLIKEKYANLDLQLARQTEEAKMAVVADFAGNLAALLGEQSRLGKVAAIAQATINTYLGATAAFAQTPGDIFIRSLAAASAVALGLKNIKEIAKVKTSYFAKGTDHSPEGLAWVGEKGRELMIDPKGNIGMSPDKASLTYLQKGTKVIPNNLTENLMSGMRPGSVTYSKQQNELIPYIKELVNKPVTSVNIDSTGITVMTKSSTTMTKRMDKYFRA